MSQFWKPGCDRQFHSEDDVLLINERNKRLSIEQQKRNLPIHRFRSDILYAVEKYSTVILIGETGSGKSTQITQFLYEVGWTSYGQSIVCTQPRRIAATTVAGRVAQEMGCILGEEVGYGIRFDSKFNSKTKIKYCTDGILLRETLSDPLLMNYSVVIIDEAHERSLESDILLGLLKKIQRKRPELKIIVTSATLNAQLMKDFFETNNTSNPEEDTSCIVSIQGRQHPIEIFYLESPASNYIRQAVETALLIHRQEGPGDILIFLPGGEEIDIAVEMINEKIDQSSQSDARKMTSSSSSSSSKGLWSLLANLIICPLYATLPTSTQAQVFFPTPPGKRKMIVATNIAETSVTIEGVRFIVDAGFVKLDYFDVSSGIDALVTCPISKAAATQRAGRAGRTEAGKCYRLMTEESYLSLSETTPPQMQRTDISAAILQLKSLGIDDILHFDFISPPPGATMIHALELLFSLGALDGEGKLTPTGERMAEMSLEPRLSRALLSSVDMGCSEEMLSVAAMLSVESPFIVQRGRASQEAKKRFAECLGEFATLEGGDQLTLLRVYQEYEAHGCDPSWCDSMCLRPAVLARAREVRAQLVSTLTRFMPRGQGLVSCQEDMDTLKRCIVSGYFANAARLGSDGHYCTLRGGHRVHPHPSSIFARFGAPPEWVVYSDVVHTKSTEMRDLVPIDPLWLMDLAEHYYDLKIRR